MLNRQPCLAIIIILGVSATGAAHAAGTRTAPSTPTTIAAPAVQSDAAHRAWNGLLTTYRMLVGLGLLQVLPDVPEIEGIQDGPDGVDPLGIKPKGIKGLVPKYQDEQPPPTPVL